MSYTILNVTKNRPVADACSKRPIVFESRDDAEKFAASYLQMLRSDAVWKRPGHRRPTPVLNVIEAAL